MWLSSSFRRELSSAQRRLDTCPIQMMITLDIQLDSYVSLSMHDRYELWFNTDNKATYELPAVQTTTQPVVDQADDRQHELPCSNLCRH